MTREPVALTCGEPAGIGSELALRAWQALRDEMAFYWIGDPRHLPKSSPVQTIEQPAQARDAMQHGLPVLPHPFPKANVFGQPDLENAQAAIDVIKQGVRQVREGQASALCTLPIHKQILQDGARFPFPGHTEFLASLCDVETAVMMLASPSLKVVPVTIHIPLSDVPKALTSERLEQTIHITHEALTSQFHLTNPRISVAGLNPHAGEGGKFGREDQEIISPVVQNLQAEGMFISGPHSADTLFHEAARRSYDVAIAMYHDQALIPIKTLDFDRGVNVTLGLPFIRTSPDHGTALDIAGQGRANPSSTIEALRLAHQMAGVT